MEEALSGHVGHAQTRASSTTTRVEEPAVHSEVYTLRLEPRPHVTFDEETAVDNEFFGRKKSKKCCIFHRKREFGESSSESEPDSDDSSSSAEKRRVTFRRKQELAKQKQPAKKKHMCNNTSCAQLHES